MQRILSFDLARGFTVLFMPMIHTVMLLSTPEVQQSFLGAIFTFIAEGPGAQIFMLLMGVNFAMSKKTTGRKAFSRSISLLIAAYLLNYAKFILPISLGIMPEPLIIELGLDPHHPAEAAFFFIGLGDILHFAGVAQLILFMVSKIKYFHIVAAILAIAIILLSPFLWDIHTGIPPFDYILNLFGGHPPQVFFPVFPWIVYPLIGLTLGHVIKSSNTDMVLKRSAIIGVVLIIVSLGLPSTPPNTLYLDFYRTRPADTIFHIGIVLTWLQLFNWLSKSSPNGGGFRRGLNPGFRLLTFCSRHITVIYLIQWVLICWLMCFTGYLTQGFLNTCIWMTATTTATLLLTWLLTRSSTKTPLQGFPGNAKGTRAPLV